MNLSRLSPLKCVVSVLWSLDRGVIAEDLYGKDLQECILQALHFIFGLRRQKGLLVDGC